MTTFRLDFKDEALFTNSLMTAWILPVQCALKYKPPVLILVYKDERTGKLRRRLMPLRGFAVTTDVSSYVEELRQSANREYVNSIPKSQLFSLLQRLKLARCKGISDVQQKDPDPVSDMSSLQDAPPIKLEVRNIDENFSQFNELLNSPLGGSSMLKSGRLLKRTLLPIDKKKNPFHRTHTLDESAGTNSSVKTGSLNDLLQSSVKPGADTTGLKSMSKESIHSSRSHIAEELEDDGTSDSQVSQDDLNQMLDLNTVTDEELHQKKAEMDVLFVAHKIEPGDPEYVYDKEVAFERKEMDESGWDTDTSSPLEPE